MAAGQGSRRRGRAGTTGALRGLAAAMLALILTLAAPPLAAGKRQAPDSRAAITLSFAPVVKRAAPAVVNIYAKTIVEQRNNPFAADPFFSQLFRDFGQPTRRVRSSLGSGVILSPDGLVVSNYHVVGGADVIRVALADRREFDAEILLADKQADLVVMRLKNARDLPWMRLTPSDELEVGDLVLAIGNPFGVGQTVSSGIISGLARSGSALGDKRSYFIQTDAPINPGNSGGALVDMKGRLVGINTSILTRSGGSNGIGFAIPADLVAAFLKQARAGNRRFVRPWAGIFGQAVDAGLAAEFGLDRPRGMVIAEMHPKSPFARAGLKVGDVILSFNGAPINGPAALLYHMTVLGIGAEGRVTYLRNGRERSATLRLIAPPDDPPRNRTTIRTPSPFRGMTVVQINPAVIAETSLPVDAQGVLVVRVADLAARLGFKPGDIIRRVNDRRIRKVADLKAAARQRPRLWIVVIERGGERLTFRFRP